MLTKLRTKLLLTPLLALGLLTGSAVVAVATAQPASASTPYGCSQTTGYNWYQAAGLRFEMQSYTQWVQTPRDGYVIFDSPIVALRTTDGRTLRAHNLVFYMQVGNSSAPWINGHRVTYNATPSYSSYHYNGSLGNERSTSNTSGWYGKHVRYIVNAQGHNFVGPWVTVGSGLYSCV
ncbi:hypothetical protein ABIB25_004275 [Nakamurella sp. UYEF19]|uniref:hypothetical protein n=1 Tax=Nakamurella sp. UYEF19 TaxID=1756392 RepID=UPI003393B614